VNIDRNPAWQPEVVRDLKRGLPFSDGVADEVLASHFLEHLYYEDFIFLVGEVYRVLKPGALFHIRVPLGVTCDLDHHMVFLESSFDTFFRPETSTYHQTPMAWSLSDKATVKEDNGTNSLVVEMRKS